VHGMDAGNEQFWLDVLEQEAAGAGLEGFVDLLVHVEGGEHDDPVEWHDSSATTLWVALIHIGVEVTATGDRLFTVRCLADHLDVRLDLEDQPESTPYPKSGRRRSAPGHIASSGSFATSSNPPPTRGRAISWPP
jgi:hypothetical protein